MDRQSWLYVRSRRTQKNLVRNSPRKKIGFGLYPGEELPQKRDDGIQKRTVLLRLWRQIRISLLPGRLCGGDDHALGIRNISVNHGRYACRSTDVIEKRDFKRGIIYRLVLYGLAGFFCRDKWYIS